MKNWFIYNKRADFQAIAQQFGISAILARLIRNRDVCDPEEIRMYLFGDVSCMHDPFLLKGVKEAVRLIFEIINRNGKIRIIGDYDIDGVCASYILKKGLEALGADADVAIPNRMEDGYGINTNMVEAAAADGVCLLLTCDNGIKATEPAKRAGELGMKMIITDHHEIPDILPESDVIINPHLADSGYPFADLCGAAVAWKLVQALFLSVPDSRQMLLDELLMFAGFATIGDVVPLKGENRLFAKEGIRRLRSCRNTGMNALIGIKGIEKTKLEAWHVGFVLGPCINSAGRLKDAALSLQLLECEDRIEAEALAAELSELNEERKRLTEQYTSQALRYLSDRFERNGHTDHVIGVYLQEAHESIAGIIAGRVKETWHRPALIVTGMEDGMKGSGRSIEKYNMIQAISAYPQYFEKFGGHAMACGFTLKRGAFHDLMDALNKDFPLQEKDLEEITWIDMQLPVEYLSEDLIREIERTQPYGQDNPKPLFADKNLKLLRFQILGAGKRTLKLYLESRSGFKIEAVMFGNERQTAERFRQLSSWSEEMNGNVELACLYYPQINEFRDMRTIQLALKDFDLSKA